MLQNVGRGVENPYGERLEKVRYGSAKETEWIE